MKNSIKIAPSILAADAAKLGEEVAKIEKAGADWLHIDIMDGHFVPNLSFSAQTVKALRPLCGLVFDVHLMLSEPEKYVDDFINAGADCITFHIEAVPDKDKLLKLVEHIKSRGARAGISLKPATPIEKLEEVLEFFELVLVMTVEPGFGAQSYMYDMEEKIKWLADKKRSLYPNLEISVDGGINKDTIASATAAGVTVVAAGTAVFGAADTAAAIENLRILAERG